MNNYWNLDCETCGQSLRILVPESKLGKTVEVTCPKCHNKTRTTIGVEDSSELLEIQYDFEDLPVEAQEAIIQICQKIREIKDSPQTADFFKVLKRFGLTTVAILGVLKVEVPSEKPVFVDSKVDEKGEVKPGVFSSKDKEDFRKLLRVKL